MGELTEGSEGERYCLGSKEGRGLDGDGQCVPAHTRGSFGMLWCLCFYSFTVILFRLQQGVAVNAIYFYVFCEL